MSDIDQRSQELAIEAEHILTTAQGYAVSSISEFEFAANELKAIKAKAREIDGQRVFLKAPVLEQAKRIEDFFRAPLKFLLDAESLLKRAMLGFQQAEEAKRLEAERKAQEAARKEQDELRRKAADDERKAKELQIQAEAAAASGDIETAIKLEARAEKLEDKADARVEQAASVIIPTIAREQPKISGISTRKVWKHRVTDARKVPRDYLMVNEKMLSDFAKATKGAIPIEGVEFYCEEVMAAGALT